MLSRVLYSSLHFDQHQRLCFHLTFTAAHRPLYCHPALSDPPDPPSCPVIPCLHSPSFGFPYLTLACPQRWFAPLQAPLLYTTIILCTAPTLTQTPCMPLLVSTGLSRGHGPCCCHSNHCKALVTCTRLQRLCAGWAPTTCSRRQRGIGSSASGRQGKACQERGTTATQESAPLLWPQPELAGVEQRCARVPTALRTPRGRSQDLCLGLCGAWQASRQGQGRRWPKSWLLQLRARQSRRGESRLKLKLQVSCLPFAGAGCEVAVKWLQPWAACTTSSAGSAHTLTCGRRAVCFEPQEATLGCARLHGGPQRLEV